MMRLADMSFTEFLLAECDLRERQRKERMKQEQFEKYAKEHGYLICAIPKNATNGEVIKAVFPNVEIEGQHHNMIGVHFGDNEFNAFYKDWWNAPYKAGE